MKSKLIRVIEELSQTRKSEVFVPQKEEDIRRKLKWMFIEKGRVVTPREINDIVEYIMMTERYTGKPYTIKQWYSDTEQNYDEGYFGLDLDSFEEIELPDYEEDSDWD